MKFTWDSVITVLTLFACSLVEAGTKLGKPKGDSLSSEWDWDMDDDTRSMQLNRARSVQGRSPRSDKEQLTRRHPPTTYPTADWEALLAQFDLKDAVDDAKKLIT